MSAPEWTIEQWVEHGREWLRAGWTWAPGQVAFATGRRVGPHRVVITDVSENHPTHATGDSLSGALGGLEVVPDLRDPGTCGHALEQVCAAFGDECSVVYCPVGMVEVMDTVTANLVFYTSDGQGHVCLLAARRAAP